MDTDFLVYSFNKPEKTQQDEVKPSGFYPYFNEFSDIKLPNSGTTIKEIKSEVETPTDKKQTTEIKQLPAITQNLSITPEASGKFVKSGKTIIGGNKKSFIEEFTPYAKRISDETGIDPRFIIAKAGLETGWGSSMNDYNFGNITTGSNWKGSFTERGDHNAKGEKIRQKFRAYSNLDEAVSDYSNFMKGKRYSGLKGLSAEDAIKHIGTTGYAEDPRYSEKLLQILKTL